MSSRIQSGVHADAGVLPSPPTPSSFKVVHDPSAVPTGLRHCVAVIGNFDGVHRGHAGVIARARSLARTLSRPCVAVTFEPHPLDVFKGPGTVFRLTPEAAKATALTRLGLDGMIVVAFDAQRAAQSAETFVAEVLVGQIGIAAAVVGYDFHFGKGRAGSPSFLRDAGRRYGFAVEVVEAIRADVDGHPEALHSTAARHALEGGRVEEAASLLGHPWFVVGEVLHGDKRGRDLGFPTANLRLDPSCRLRHGIYAVRMVVDGTPGDGVASFGRRPTFDDGAPLLEVFLFDFAGDLYGKTVEVAFIGWIRGEEKFDSAEALVERMNVDVEEAKTILRKGGRDRARTPSPLAGEGGPRSGSDEG